MIGDIHLSWSPLQLYMACCMLFVAFMIALYNLREHKKYVVGVAFALVVVIGVSAFDVGTRQVDLGRNKFDVETPVLTIDKVESEHNTAASIKQQFNETTQKLKETK